MFVVCVKVFLEVSVAEFITLLIFSILLTVLLHGIVCQMNEIVFAIFDVILERCSANVALSIPVTFELAIYAGHHHVMSDIEFPPKIQKWLLQILLNDEST
jgi:hypothetical protein